MSGCICFYCRQGAPCLCDTMIEHIVDNVNQEQQDIEDDNVEYPIYE